MSTMPTIPATPTPPPASHVLDATAPPSLGVKRRREDNKDVSIIGELDTSLKTIADLMVVVHIKTFLLRNTIELFRQLSRCDSLNDFMSFLIPVGADDYDGSEFDRCLYRLITYMETLILKAIVDTQVILEFLDKEVNYGGGVVDVGSLSIRIPAEFPPEPSALFYKDHGNATIAKNIGSIFMWGDFTATKTKDDGALLGGCSSKITLFYYRLMVKVLERSECSDTVFTKFVL